MFEKLPDDIKIIIYQYLLWDEIIDIETNDDNLITIIKLNNRKYPEKILRNLKYKLCFYCYEFLGVSYVLNICSYCKFKIDGSDLYPLVCRTCIPLKNDRSCSYRKCKLCSFHCGYLGIMPYS